MRTAVLGAALLVVGLVALLAGVLTLEELRTLVERVAPVLGFVVALTIVSELAAEAGLFSWLAGFAARAARGRVVVLWAFVVVLALGCTIFLSLDTTAVLLTPVVVLVARRVGLPPMPFALTTVWLANCGSMLLPVSNLTNLLALDALGSPSPASFAALVAPAAVVAAVVPVVAVGLRYRRELSGRFEAPEREEAGDRVLFVVAAVAVALLVPALVSGIEVWIPAAVAALVLVVVTAVRRPSTLRLGLVPWGTIVFASGLFVVVEAAHSLGLADALAVLVGSGDGLPDLLRLAAGSAAAANVANNLPAYLALEPVAGSPLRLVAVLVGVNVGCLVAPWASLATLLWHGRLTSMGVEVRWRGVVLGGLGVAVVAVPLAVVATVLVGA
ncbi:SLC13 family permease [Frigoribacterium sp. PvP032]|uniref:SLC13 family permease n=1 Tax=Frigoribacterium sp. PvP032 TaxID=2806589 RepID=UPI001AE2AF48|nr:SLC13 family permease [Frigoribacterium sp. PvP032]MBP1190317.1 Na+/H+ antiporter NhaD/arsenite permease-like protein [Frigoribacterium sp. PvP032]